jgi:hypothetical protein
MFDKRTCHQVMLLLIGFSASIAFSASQPASNFLHSVFDAKRYTPVVTFTVGPDFVEAGQAQNVTLLPPYQNHYTSNGASQTVADAGVFLGIERVITPWLTTQLGVSGYVDEEISAQGDVWQFAVPAFDDSRYSYHIHHSRVVFTNKLLTAIPRWQAIHPYFSWEIGSAYNNAKGYQEVALDPTVNPAAPFANHSQSALTWGVGLGVDYALNSHVRAGIGYQFTDLGSASLGSTPSATSPSETLRLSHLYTNQLRFQFTFVV